MECTYSHPLLAGEKKSISKDVYRRNILEATSKAIYKRRIISETTLKALYKIRNMVKCSRIGKRQLMFRLPSVGTYIFIGTLKVKR